MAKAQKWVRNVKTVSTYPPKDLFTKDAQTIARTMAKKSVSPRGVGSGIRMIQYFINRAGKSLSMTRKRELEKAKRILQKKQKAQTKGRQDEEVLDMIRKLASGEYRLYSRKKNPKTGRRRNLGTFSTRAAAEKHERAVQYFKRHN